MRFAIDVAPLGPLADPRAVARLARAAEDASWDGLSTWDSLGTSIGAEAADPFVTLAAAATATERLRLITSVLALPRRRPQLVSQAAATLDRLSDGRLILGLGAGGDRGDFEPFGEPFADGGRIARLDEGLSVVERLLRGERVTHAGASYTLGDAHVPQRPTQRPRPPIWLGGMRPGALRRAARLEGWIAIGAAEDGASMALSVDDLARRVARLRREREELGRTTAFDIAVFGLSQAGGTDMAAWATAGATWWLESLSPMRGSLEDLLSLVRQGPPGAQ